MTNLQIANTIRTQLGNRALFMIGAKDLVATETGLQFRIGRNAKSVNQIVINLDPSDTYTVEFRRTRMSRKTGYSNKVVSSLEGVYADMLHDVIESGTGLATRL